MAKTWKMGEADVLVEPQSFTAIQDDWSVYELSPSGVKVRIRIVLAKVALKLDENGEVIRNEDGDPQVVVASNTILVTEEGD